MKPLHGTEFILKLLQQIGNAKEENKIKVLRSVKRIQGVLHVVLKDLDSPLCS